MRYLLVIALFALALPAAAQEDTQVVEISHELITTEDGARPFHKVASISGNTTDIRTSINGHFLWVTFGDPEDTYEAVSVDVSDTAITQAIVSLDGAVTLVREASEPTVGSPEPTQPEIETIDLVTKYPDHDVF